jgi:hypothetical protein
MTSSTTHRIAVVLAALVALAAFTGSALASTSKPPEMTKAEYRALVLRSEALNEKYRLGEWKNVPKGMTPPEYHALMARSEGLNKRYGLGKWSTTSSNRVTTVATNGFSWGAFGIGAAAALGLVLLAGGLVAGGRHTRQSTRVRTS